MHARNGKPLQNGDKVMMLDHNGQPMAIGVLHSAVPGNSYCNGNIAPIQAPLQMACLCDCIKLDDIAELLREKGLDKRPEGM